MGPVEAIDRDIHVDQDVGVYRGVLAGKGRHRSIRPSVGLRRGPLLLLLCLGLLLVVLLCLGLLLVVLLCLGLLLVVLLCLGLLLLLLLLLLPPLQPPLLPPPPPGAHREEGSLLLHACMRRCCVHSRIVRGHRGGPKLRGGGGRVFCEECVHLQELVQGLLDAPRQDLAVHNAWMQRLPNAEQAPHEA